MKIIKRISILFVALFCLLTAACTGVKLPCTTCRDDNADHYCEVCVKKISGCKDENKDHICDICDISVGVCVDANANHNCDICSTRITDCKDTDNDHHCDICEKRISACVDAVEDSQCDICGVALSSIDYEEMTNTITKEYMHGIVTVRSQYLEWDRLRSS